MSYSLCTLAKHCAAETENYGQLVPPDLFAELWSLFYNRHMPYRDTHVEVLLAMWEVEELPGRDAAGERDSEPECASSRLALNKETEPAASSLDSDPSGEGDSEPLLMALPRDPKVLSCTLPARPTEEPNAACVEADCSQDSLDQENPSGPVVLAGPCSVPSQPLECCVPSPTTNMTTVPLSPAPRQWLSIVKTAWRALRRLFSFSCLRGQPEE